MKNTTRIILSIVISLVGNIFAQDWSISLGNYDHSNNLENDWKLKLGRIQTSESFLTSSHRLLQATKHQRLPVGVYGWGLQTIVKDEDWKFVFDITSDKNLPLHKVFDGLEIGSRFQYNLSDDWFIGCNATYDFGDRRYFTASDIGYQKDDFSIRIVGYCADYVQGGFLFARYQVTDWLQIEMGLDHRSGDKDLDRLIGLRFQVNEDWPIVTLDYIHDDSGKGIDTFKSRVVWTF